MVWALTYFMFECSSSMWKAKISPADWALSLSVPAAGHHTCCTSSRGFDEHAHEARLPRAPPLPHCESHSCYSFCEWPPAESCQAVALSHKARCSKSPHRYELQETPPETERHSYYFYTVNECIKYMWQLTMYKIICTKQNSWWHKKMQCSY